MRQCPRCGQPLVLELKNGGQVERCTRRGCGYHAWIVPLDQTVATRPKYGNLWPVGEKA